MLTTANAAETNGLACLQKHGGALNNTFLVTHPMNNERCHPTDRGAIKLLSKIGTNLIFQDRQQEVILFYTLPLTIIPLSGVGTTCTFSFFLSFFFIML
jgi:hypothetical protein